MQQPSSCPQVSLCMPCNSAQVSSLCEFASLVSHGILLRSLLVVVAWLWGTHVGCSDRTFPLPRTIHCYDRFSPRRGKERQPAATAGAAVPDVHDVRVGGEGSKTQFGPGLGRPLHQGPPRDGLSLAGHPSSAQKLLTHRRNTRKDGRGHVQATAKAAANQKGKGKGKDGKAPLNATGSSKSCEAPGGCSVPVVRGGWGDMFNCLVALKDRSRLANHIRLAILSLSCSLVGVESRCLMVGHELGVVEDIECSLRWLQTGCLRLSEAPAGRSLRQLASRAAQEACCTSSLEFSGDKRGLREVLANIVNRTPSSLNFDSLHFSAGPVQWSYDGSARQPAGALRIQSGRIALPDPACVVSMEDWLPKSVAQSSNSPAGTGQPIAPSFFLNVSCAAW